MDCARQIDVQCYECIFRHIDYLADLLDMPFEVQRCCIEQVMRELLRTHGHSITTVQLVRFATNIALSLMDLDENFDPYAQLKQQTNETVLKHQKSLSGLIQGAESPLSMALQLVASANMIDVGGLCPNFLNVQDALRTLPQRRFSVYHFDTLYERLIAAKNLLYICDNAGEIVLDRLFVEELDRHFPQLEITCVVRHKPIVNDALLQDAITVGLDQVANVLSSGSVYPGIIMEETTAMFQKYFDIADVIITKGVGNFTTLSEIRDRRLFFIFAASCPMIARLTNSEFGQIVLAHNHLGFRSP